jgi:hypothetical protein
VRRGVFEGWTGTVVVTVLGLVLVGGLLGGAVLLGRQHDGLDPSLFEAPGAVALPGMLECTLPPDAAGAPVQGPRSVRALVALRDGQVLATGSDGGLWRGDPATGALQRWADQPEATGGVQALGRDPLGRHVFVAGPAAVAAVDLATGEVASSQPLPAEAAGGVAAVAATSRRVYVVTTSGVLLEARWSYGRLAPPAPMVTRSPLPPVRQALAAPNGESLLLGTDGPLLRLGVGSGRPQEIPVGDLVPVTSLSQGTDGLVHLVDGSSLRVLDLNERWVTGRLSGPVEGWTAPAQQVAAVPGALVVADAAGALTTVPTPTCNREELTRLGSTPTG